LLRKPGQPKAKERKGGLLYEVSKPNRTREIMQSDDG
jgi:hypothetical protein